MRCGEREGWGTGKSMQERGGKGKGRKKGKKEWDRTVTEGGGGDMGYEEKKEKREGMHEQHILCQVQLVEDNLG